MDATYDYMINAILSFYNPSSDIWTRVKTGAATGAEVHAAFSSIPQMQVQMASDGTRVLGYDYMRGSVPTMFYDDYVSEKWQDLIDSNLGGGRYSKGNSYTLNVPSYASSGGGADVYDFSSGGRDLTGGVPGNTAMIIADKASLALTGVNVGAKLGMAIDNAIYNINPQWWDENYPAINPQTWPSISTSEGGKSFIRTLFGIKDGAPTAYVSSEVLAQTYMLLRDKGALNSRTEANYTGSTSRFPAPTVTTLPTTSNSYGPSGGGQFYEYSTSDGYFVRFKKGPSLYFFSKKSNGSAHYKVTNLSTGAIDSEGNITANESATTFSSGTRFYYRLAPYGSNSFESPARSGVPLSQYGVPSLEGLRQIGTILFDGTVRKISGVDGISELDNTAAPYGVPSPQTITGTTISDVIDQLKTNYPWLFDGSIETATPQIDGSIKHDEYVPVPFAKTDTMGKDKVITEDLTQTQTQVDPDTFTKITTRDPVNNPPDTGSGEPEALVMPTGNASSLWAVYHPSQSQLNAFGAWLWSSDFVEQIKRLFNDPMQAIIGVHKVFAPIPTGASQTIKCGYLDSGVSSPTVSSQYTEVDCGTVKLYEYFGNVFDYEPHTKISIYLPFIGVVPLKVSEVMRGSVSVKYGVDVITGACLAMVSVSRDGAGGVMYSYGGSCACHYPISSGSYAGIISGIVTSAIGIAGGIATGNPIATIGGAMAGLHQAHTEIQRSGGFTGCAGAMGPKTPYLIIDRPQTRLAADFEAYQGKPANSTQFIGDCSGFVRATEVHFSAPGVFDEEAREVESLLKAGVKLD